MRAETDTTSLDPAIAPATDAPPEDIPVDELIELLNDAFQVEVQRRRAALAGESQVAEPDGGVRAARGLLVAGAIGVVLWSGILALLVALA